MADRMFCALSKPADVVALMGSQRLFSIVTGLDLCL